MALDNDQDILIEQFEPSLGAPFRVVLCDAVRQKVSGNGDVLETHIPNMKGLLLAVAANRSLCDRKFSAEDIKFVRKCLGMRAGKLAEILGISAEHLSRCENGDRVLSISAEKLLRIIAIEKRYDTSKFEAELQGLLETKQLDTDKSDKARELIRAYCSAIGDLKVAIMDLKISSVFDHHDKLEMFFSLKSPVREETDPDSEGEWMKKAA